MDARIFIAVLASVTLCCTACSKKEKKEVIQKLDTMHGRVVEAMYPDSMPRDVYYYRVDENGQLTNDIYYEAHYYDNKKVYMEGGRDGKERDGKWQAYFENGKIQATATYVKGLQVGDEKVYYENGNLMYKGIYDNGVCCGTWIFYDEHGKVKKQVEVSDTTLMCGQCPKCLVLKEKKQQEIAEKHKNNEK